LAGGVPIQPVYFKGFHRLLGEKVEDEYYK
jgi:hypothetical protein